MKLYQKTLFCLSLVLNLTSTPLHADTEEVERSNQITMQFTHELAAYLPEQASEIGFSEYDDKTSNISPDLDDKLLSFYQGWYKKLLNLSYLTNTHDGFIDLELLSDYVQNQIESIRLNRSEKVIPLIPGSQLVFESIHTLINAQTSDARKSAAIKRFHRYVDSEFLLANQQYVENIIQKYPSNDALYPSIDALNHYLESSPVYVDAIKQLLESTNDTTWQDDFTQYQTQVIAFDAFIRKVLLPHARHTSKIPKALYRQTLKSYGLRDANIEQMIITGKKDYAALYQTYEALAKQIADKYHLPSSTPKAVIAFLKQQQFTSPEDVLALYQTTSAQIEAIIEANQILTLPKEPLKIRLATLAESKAMPAPHIYMPPRVNNTGMTPEFIVPTALKGLPYDDFTYPSITIALMAHEGRPGHDLHLRRVLSPEMSLVRASFAENPVNHEGWALYAEDLIYPYVDIEAQFGILQMRLLRIARYFLDPMVQQGLASRNDVINYLHHEIGISRAFAEVEYQRYAYIAPGQATAYYHGLLKIKALKTALTETLGDLSPKCFHDTLLSFGLMPTEYVWDLKAHFKHCSHVVTPQVRHV
ncbi:MAG: DUF885 domain-containing protein [Legionellaceae bacterium]|nr:DUF885 domain-containing protein [Legionellaceae bacterium]